MCQKILLSPYLRIMIGFIKYFILIVILLGNIESIAQSKDELERERKKIINDIENTNKYLKSTQKEKSTALNDLTALNKQVESRKKLIDNVQKELISADGLLKKNELTKDSINKAYDKLLIQYSAILRYNYLQNLSNQKISYLLSSESLNTFLLRYQYVKQFESFQSQKKKDLQLLREKLIIADESIKQKKEERGKLLNIEKEQYSKLENEKKTKNTLLTGISKKESQLKSELSQKKKAREKLNQEIENIILAQLKAASERESNSNLSKADAKLSSNFSQNRGKLPWPVENGFISSKFGKKPHPTLKGITIENNGIDISCTGSLTVKAVFEGEVVGIIKVIGNGNMVLVNHGTYHSVYSNLTDVVVRQGDKINRGQTIGSLANGTDGRAELHFELWKDKTKLDPQTWIK